MKNKQNFCFTKSKAYGLCGVVITISLFSTTQVNADETTSGTKPRTEQIVSVVSETPTQEEVIKVAENDKQKEISLTPYIKSVSQMTRPTSTEVKITHTVTNTSSLTILSSNWYVPFATISRTDLTPLKWSNERLGFLYPDNTSKVPEGSLLKIVDSTNSLNTNLLEYVERGNNEGLLYNAKPEIINLSTDKVARINIGRLNPGETVILSYTFCITDPSGNLINDFAYNIASYKYGVVKAANITANYVDEQGNTISDNVVLNGNVGDTYSTEQKTIPGYTFKEVQGSASGQFTDQEQTVTYVYTKDPATTASTSTTTVEPTTTVSTSTTTVEPTTTVAATTTTVEPTTTAAATTTTVEPTTTVAATTTTVEPTTTAAATTTAASTTTVAPTTSVTTTAATTVNVPGTTTGVTPPPAGGKKGRTLPKTGEESGLTTSLVGFALMSVAGMAGVLYRKSKKA